MYNRSAERIQFAQRKLSNEKGKRSPLHKLQQQTCAHTHRWCMLLYFASCIRIIRDHGKHFWQQKKASPFLVPCQRPTSGRLWMPVHSSRFVFIYIQFDIFHYVWIFVVFAAALWTVVGTCRHHAVARVFVNKCTCHHNGALRVYTTNNEKWEREKREGERAKTYASSTWQYQTSENLINGMCRI